MRGRSWLILGLLWLFPTRTYAQRAQPTTTHVTEAEFLGGWRLQAQYAADSVGERMQKEGNRGWLVLWPDHLWGYGGGLMGHRHGGARWRLIGDTLWLSNDYDPYFHPLIWPRIKDIAEKGHGFGVVDRSVIGNGVEYDVPDSVFWSPAFQDTNPYTNQFVWAYTIMKRSKDTLSLARVDKLSHGTASVATAMVLTRDSLKSCVTPPFPLSLKTYSERRRYRQWLTDQLEIHHPGGAWVAGCP